ncbi:MAG TPA: SRPBCC family protein [Acidimicrobiales bacterium]|nr:SRPBCC family protein [Acidimicrobiales bacterium]
MGAVQEECEFGVGIDEAWKVIGDFGGLLEALGVPFELEGAGIGQTRKISMGDEPTVERLEERDDDSRRLVYSIVAGALPLQNYVSTMQLRPAGDGRTHLTWSSTFDAAAGSTDEDACTLVRGIYRGGMAGLQKHFGG